MNLVRHTQLRSGLWLVLALLLVGSAPFYLGQARRLRFDRPALQPGGNVAPYRRPPAREPLALDVPRLTPFRIGHRLPRIRYGEVIAPSVPIAPPPPKPVLALTGVVLGAHPSALVEGVPGASGPVIWRVGQEAGGLRLVAIEPSGVTISGMDTTWHLMIRRPW